MFKIYVLSYCGFSNKALQLLQENNLKFERIECDDIRHETDNIKPNFETYPKIFFNSIFIGGCDEFKNILLLKNKQIQNNNSTTIITDTEYLKKKEILEILYYIIDKSIK